MRLPFFLRLVFNRYFFQKVAALALLGLFAYALSDFLFIFLITFLFAYLFLDFSNWVMDKLRTLSVKVGKGPVRNAINRINRLGIIVTTIYVIFVTGVVVLFSSLVPQILNESKGIVTQLPSVVSNLEGTVSHIEATLKVDFGFRKAVMNFFDKGSMEQTMKNVFDNVRNAGIVIGKIVIALVLSYVFIIDRPKIMRFLESSKKGNFAFLYDEYSVILSKIGKGFGLIFKAQAFIALVNSLLTVLGLLVISAVHGGEVFPYVSTLGVMVFIMGFVPVLGFIISSLPILLVGYNYGGQPTVLMILAMIAIVHAVEAYYLNPKIVSSYMEFPVFITFLILLVSEHAFGFVGLLVGVPLFYILLDVVRDVDEYVEKVKRVTTAINSTKTSTKEAIHKGIRLSRSQGPSEE